MSGETRTNEKRLYEHDCDKCTYLGAYMGADLYHCRQGGKLPTVIARFSSEGSDYISRLSFVEWEHHLKEAYERAHKLNLELCT